MADIIKITSKEQFDKEIKEGKVLVDFNATWCGPCKMLTPILHDFAKKVDGVKFLDVDVDLNRQVAEEFRIMSIPTLITFENGNQVNKHIGFATPDQLKKLID
ncbi:thioredoxin [Mycoplasma mycoides subsp. capri]|uniref:thioredoxin n=1 Tax=Mycoplasma mycoides TaxID=2102 RepID=UPI002240396F|nr:thioredoxin [Mycoplasma mycoides]UZK64234.1 thioredoxin [Mycoplasma mycoides subsp. capri]